MVALRLILQQKELGTRTVSNRSRQALHCACDRGPRSSSEPHKTLKAFTTSSTAKRVNFEVQNTICLETFENAPINGYWGSNDFTSPCIKQGERLCRKSIPSETCTAILFRVLKVNGCLAWANNAASRTSSPPLPFLGGIAFASILGRSGWYIGLAEGFISNWSVGTNIENVASWRTWCKEPPAMNLPTFMGYMLFAENRQPQQCQLRALLQDEQKVRPVIRPYSGCSSVVEVAHLNCELLNPQHARENGNIISNKSWPERSFTCIAEIC